MTQPGISTNSLPDHSVQNFTELSMILSHHFMANKQARKTSMHLDKVLQGQNESLHSYVQRFNLEMLQIPDLADGVAFDSFIKGLAPTRFKFDIVKKGVKSLQEVLTEAESFIHATEISAATKPEKEKKEDGRMDVTAKKKDEMKKQIWTVGPQMGGNGSSTQKRARPYELAYEFNKDSYTILMEIKDKFEFEAPQPLRGPTKYRNHNKYCQYHKDVGMIPMTATTSKGC